MITKERLIEEIGRRLQRLPAGEMKELAIKLYEESKHTKWFNHFEIEVLKENIEKGDSLIFAFSWINRGEPASSFDFGAYQSEHRELLSGPIEDYSMEWIAKQNDNQLDLMTETLNKSTPAYGEWGDMPLGSTANDDEFSVFKITYKNGHRFQVLHKAIAQRMVKFERGMGIQEFRFPMKYFPQIAEMLKEVL